MAASTVDEDDIIDAQKVVKTFSWKSYADDPDDDLAKSLVIAEASIKVEEKKEGTSTEQWMELFDPAITKALSGGQDDIILAHPTDELAQAYKKFLKCLPKGHEARIEDGPPRLEVVVDALTFAEAKWKNNREKTKAGRMRTLFSKVAVNLNKYKELFAIVPSSDRYVSLIAGSVSAIIKATVNHEKIAESVSNALDDLSDDMAYWKDLVEIIEQNTCTGYFIRTENYISKMYVLVFKFLAAIMTKWSSKSSIARLFRSFDSEFFKTEIEDKTTKIRDLEYRLRRQSDLAMQRNLKNIIPKADMAQLITDSQANFQAEWLIVLNQQLLNLGQTVKITLEEQYRSQRQEQLESTRRTALAITGVSSSRNPSPILEDSGTRGEYYAVSQVQLNALQQLRAYTSQQHIPTLAVQARFLNVHGEILNRIQRWNAASTSQTLWIQGPFQVPQPSRYTQLSAYVVMTAQKANVPALYYFCDSTTSTVDLILTLIAQLVRALPNDFRSEFDFSAARFEALNQEESNAFDRAIILFKDLLAVGPYMLFVIIDGLQTLDRSSNRAQLQGLVDVLRSAGKDERAEQKRVTKTLFTTDGFTDVLIRLNGAERMSGVDFFGEGGAGPEIDGIEVGFL